MLRNNFKTVLTFSLLCLVALSNLGYMVQMAHAELNHTQIYPHTKVMMVDYMSGGWNSPANDPEVKEFMATRYDLIVGGGRDFSACTSNPPVQLSYINYYCMYVKESGNWEYQDAKRWAEDHGVDFESFFIHYAEDTRACYGDVCYDLPAGSRVPSYDWYGSGGDLARDGARVILNPGNPSYRAWRLDYLERQFNSNSNWDGVFVDNTYLASVGVKTPTILSGGTYQEYQGENAGIDYGNDLLILFREFKEKFGKSKVQVPNVAQYDDSQSRIDRAYGGGDPNSPYIWGVVREFALQPHRAVWLPSMAENIQQSEAYGVENLMGGFAIAPRYKVPYLCLYYLVKSDSTYFFPFLPYIADQFGIDPRENQWIEAVTYDIGQPVNDPPEAQKYRIYYTGIDPSSPSKDIMNVTEVTPVGSSYRLIDPDKNWADEQWSGKRIVFPSGHVMSVYHSGPDWISLWAPSEVPTTGEYQVGDRAYSVLGREFEKALVLFKPLPSWNVTETGDPSATIHNLPATTYNSSGQYYLLNDDGTLNTTPIREISLRNTDGVILVKASIIEDDEPPTRPTNLMATPISSSQIDLSWDASADNIRVLGYKIYRDGNQVGISRTTTYSDTGLLLGKTYTYYVIAYDFPGNESEKSNSVSITLTHTPFASDLTQVKAYPNPFRGDKHSQIIFSNLTANVNIKIYTLTGELVKEIKEQVGDKAYWDVKNKKGKAVSSGIYIYYITNPKGQEKKGKVAIIR